MSGRCDGCLEMYAVGESIEISGRVYGLCDDCCRKLRDVIDGGRL